MKKYGKRIAFLVLALFGFLTIVNAEDESCTVDDKVRLNNLVSMVQINYDLALEGVYYGVDINIRNLNPDLYIVATSKQTKPILMDSRNFNSNNEIVIRKMNIETIDKIDFVIYSYNQCENKPLRTIPLTIPKFNYNSQMLLCEDVPEFYLCQPLVTYDIEDADYEKEIAEYKARLAAQENKKALESKSKNDSIADTISKNKYLIVIVVIAIGVAATVYVVKRKGVK